MTDLFRYYDPETRTIVRMDGKAAGGTIGDDNATVLHFEYPKGFMDTRIAYLVFNVKDDAGNYLYYTPLTTPPFDGYSFAIPAAVMSKVRKNNLSYGLGFVQGANNNQGGGLPDHLAVENSIAQNLIIGTFPPKPSEIAVGPDTPIPTDIIPTYPAPIGIPNPTDRAWIEYLLHNSLMGVEYDADTDSFVFTSYSGHKWVVSVAESISITELIYAPNVTLKQKLDEMDATDVSLMDGKVDKIAGKGLSANDFTNENLARLNSTASIEELAAEHTLIVATDGKINTHIADLANPHAVTKAQVGLGNADNTSDANKPVSILQQAALDGKVDKMANFGLSSNDYTSAEKVKLAGIAPGAEVNVNADWNATDGDALIFNKPTLGTAAARNVGTAPGEVPVIAGNGKLSDSIIPSLAIGEYVGEVTSRANLTTLTTAQQGDIAKVSGDSDVNNNGVWFLNGTYSTPVAWIQIVGPGSVISVNGQSGIVVLSYTDVGAVPSTRTVNSHSLNTDIVLSKADVGLGNADNTSDADKPISTATMNAINLILASISATDSRFNNHLADTSNPHAVTKAQVGLGNVDNTADASKPVSTHQQTALDAKVDKVSGFALSSNDYTATEKIKLAGIAAGAEVNVNADWTAADGDAQILNKPVLGTAASKNTGISVGDVPIIGGNGKLHDSIIPPLAIGEFAGSVTVKANLVTLATAQQGDIAKVTADPDINNDGVWFLNGLYSDLTAWIQIVGPGAVISVNGQSGIVNLTYADVNAVPVTRTVNTKPLSADVVLDHTDVNAVPVTRRINEKPLSADVVLTPADVGAVPSTRTVNSHSLNTDIVLSKADVGLGNADNTSDANKPISNATQTALNAKADDSDVVHNNRGTPVWSSLITYAQDSTVTYNGDLYISQNDSNTGNIPDEPLTAWWTLVRGSGGGGGDDPGAYKAFLLGDGASTDFVCNHGFNSYLTAHVIYSNLGDRETVDAVFERISKNRTKVTFYTAPAEGEFTCVIYRPGLGPESVVTSFNGQTGDVEITGDDLDVLSTVAQALTSAQKAQTKTNIDLENVDNTRDAIKPVSGPQQTALDGKVDKIAGKGLSTEDFSTAEKTKLSTVEEGAEVNVNADWNAASGDAQILNKPTLGTVAERDVGTSSGQVPILNVNGKLPDSVIPPLAIGEYAGSVSTKAELVTLANAQEGDIAKVTADPDINNDGVWFLNGVYSDLNAWIQIVGPGAVISVNGQGGVVVLTAADVGAVPTTRKVNNKALASDIVLGASDVSAVPNTRKVNNKALSSDIALTPADVGAVPPERTVNNKALSADIVLSPADVGAVPTTRKVNGKPLSSDISLGASDVGAVPPERTVNQKPLSADISLTPADIGAVPPERTVNGYSLSSDVVLSPADVGAVPDTRKVNNKTLSSDVTLDASDVGAVPTVRKINDKALSADVSLDYSDVGAVPDTRKVNDKTLSSDVTLNASDVGAVPDTRKVNNKALSQDISLDYVDVGAVPTVRKINDKALSADVSLDYSDVGAVPTTRTVNSNPLSADIVLGASDVGAVPVTRKISGNALSQDINLVAADITDGILDIARLPTGTAAGNIPVLNSKGKLADSVIPPLAIGEVAGKVDERSDLVTLDNAQQGDIAVVEDDGDIDNNGVYWLNGDYSNLSDWVQIVGPGAVISVNGHSGIVTLDYTDVGAVPASRTVNNKVLSSDISLGASDVGAVPTTRKVNNKALSADVILTPADVGAVPTTRKVNNKALSSDISLGASDVGAVPIARTVNGHALSSDVVVDKADVGLSNADNTSDANKPISNATQTALGSKVDKNPSITAGTSPKVSYDAKGLITAGHSLAAADIPDISATYVTVSGTGRANRNVITGSDGNIVYAVPPVLGTAAALNVGTESGNVPVLNASGKLADSVVPPLAIGDYIGEVTTKAGLTGFTSAQKGDIAKVTADPTMDNNGVYWLNGSYAMLTDWIQIVGPGAVISVQGKSGVVVLAPADIGAVPVARTVNGYALTGNIAITKADVGLGNAENTTDANKPISTATQTALNAKQNTLTFDDAPTSGSSNPVKSGGVFSSIATRVPTARTVNTKPLSADVILNAADVGALASNSVVDNLTTDSATAPLSAGMGRTLENGKVFYSAVMPPANANNLGKCFVAIGSPSGMTRGNIYQCTQSGSTYAWTNRSTFGSAAFRDVGVSANGVLSPTTAGTVGQSVRVASNGTALEWYTPSSSSLAVYNGSFTGNGTATSFTLNHGLTGTPVAQVTASGEVVYPDVSVSGTSIVVTFYTAPVSGSVYEVRAIA